MKGALAFGNLLGTPLKVHWSFAILLLYIFFISWYKEIDAAQVALNFAFVFAIFACVILHELGHALAAKFYGIKTTEIVVLPIGGVAIFERKWVTALQEFVIALAGPTANFLVALLLWLGLSIFYSPRLEYIGVREQILNISTSFAERLLWVNLLIGSFNLIPTLPLDGGLMSRAILTMISNRATANRIQFLLSMVIALGFVVYSYYFHAVEYLIFAWFIYFSARNSRVQP
jgi:Zn-dependent protease